MKDQVTTEPNGLTYRTDGYLLVVRPPGTYTIHVAAGWNFLDIYLGKSKGHFHIAGLETLGQTSQPNSFLFLPANGTHNISARRSAWSVQLEIEKAALDRLLRKLPQINPLGVRAIRNGADPAIHGIVQLLNCYWTNRGGELEAKQIDAVILLLATRISHHFGRTDDPVPQMSSSSRRIQSVLDYIETNIGASLNLERLAAVAAVSPYHFARVFRRATGRSPHQYVVERRIAVAKQRLTQTDDAIASIAIDCGFGSQSHMTDVFGKVLGTTPGAIRKDQH